MNNSSGLEDFSSDSIQKRLRELGPKPYSNSELMAFTSKFSDSNKIGSGGYGDVYRGQFPSGVLVAIKVLRMKEAMEDTFMAEVNTMSKAYHRNLIKLYGYCFEHDMKALVYEYMENGSLDKILYENHHSDITWEKLYGIAIETAKGLNYLHNDLDEQIIHHDIKAANVLLDKNFSAKITDFGLARIMNRDVSRVDVTRIRGTNGYNAPETWMPGSQVTFKCDVYSFGMMLFELLGKRSNGVEGNWFPIHVWRQFQNGKLEQLIRDCGIKENDKKKAEILCVVALSCAHHSPEQRPSMMAVVMMLEENMPVWKPPYPFLPGQFSYSSMLPSQERFPQLFLEVPPALNESLQEKMFVDGEEDFATFVANKGMKLPTTKLVAKTASLKYAEMVLQLIKNDETVTVGIHGMGGVGKTTILKNVYNQLLTEQNCFDKIIWVTVSKDANVSKVQNDVAKALGLNLSREDDIFERSRLLLYALEQRKRFMLVLDDVWQAISLVEIGIPEPTKDNGCKLILTTRLLEVCRRMGCRQNNIVKVEPLQEGEALELFLDKVGVVLAPQVMDIAKKVCKECAGLPLAVIVISGAMKGNEDISEWRIALSELKDSSNRILDLEDNVFKCLEFSYERLGNENLRKCFLYCALYPEDWVIPTVDLVDYWILDGLIEGSNRQEELDQGRFILNKLNNHCLLESHNSYNIEYHQWSYGVKLHDLIRNMALRITSKSFMVKGGVLLTELPNETYWGEVLERASFMDNNIRQISICPACPNLSTLFLSNNPLLQTIAHNFFVHMQCLRVLDLRVDWRGENSKMEYLPASISDLVNLRALRLSWFSRLKRVPSLSKLVLLRMLELDHTAIEELPEGIEMLVNLRCLNLNYAKLRETIPIGLISKLSTLQELYLGWIDVDKLYILESGETFVEELLSLKELEALHVAFRCLTDYGSYVRSAKFQKLKRFCLETGEASELFSPSKKRIVRFSYSSDNVLQNAHFLPENTERFEMDGFNHLTSLCDLGEFINNVRNLRQCRIKNCNNIERLISSEDEKEQMGGTTSISWLQSLESVEIRNCPKLNTLFKAMPATDIVFCLKELHIAVCHNLKNIFWSSKLLQQLPNLEVINIQMCDEMEGLIGEEVGSRNTDNIITLPKFKSLLLGKLQNFKSIWRGVMICDSLETVIVSHCLNLKGFPQIRGKDQSPPSALRYIKGSREWWDSLEWDPAYPQNILQTFFSPSEAGKDREEISQSDLDIHIDVVCDICMMNPILGKRYKCKDCWEGRVITHGGIGFDLCEECYRTHSKNHPQGHKFELIIASTS